MFRIGVGHGLLGMQHGGDAAEYDRYANFAKGIGDFPTAFHLNGQHHGDADHIRSIVPVDGLQVFIDKRDVNIIGQ